MIVMRSLKKTPMMLANVLRFGASGYVKIRKISRS